MAIIFAAVGSAIFSSVMRDEGASWRKIIAILICFYFVCALFMLGGIAAAIVPMPLWGMLIWGVIFTLITGLGALLLMAIIGCRRVWNENPATRDIFRIKDIKND